MIDMSTAAVTSSTTSMSDLSLIFQDRGGGPPPPAAAPEELFPDGTPPPHPQDKAVVAAVNDDNKPALPRHTPPAESDLSGGEIKQDPLILELAKTDVVVVVLDSTDHPDGNGDSREDESGFRTPTSTEHKIPAVTECPPAPRKKRKKKTTRKDHCCYDAVSSEEVALHRHRFEFDFKRRRL